VVLTGSDLDTFFRLPHLVKDLRPGLKYRGLILPQSPVSDGTSPKCACNAQIRARHEKGESIATQAEVFGITGQRLWQILNGYRK
jgi:hypothetical protein